MSKKPIIQVEKLVKKYNGKRVVKGISFEVYEGEIFGILGPNGAGKSTTLEMIETLRPMDGGKVTLDGFDVEKQAKKVKNVIGIQLQNTAFMAKLNLREQLKMFAGLYGTKRNGKKFKNYSRRHYVR
jgi:ABC-2 type transport system ATP-binding protein